MQIAIPVLTGLFEAQRARHAMVENIVSLPSCVSRCTTVSIPITPVVQAVVTQAQATFAGEVIFVN